MFQKWRMCYGDSCPWFWFSSCIQSTKNIVGVLYPFTRSQRLFSSETIFVRDNFRQRHHQHLRKEFEPQCGHVTSECNLILVVFLLQELNGPKNGQEAKNPILVKLSEPFTARYVRFIPTSAPVLKVMRAELYGCMAEPLPPFSGMRTFTPLISTYKLSAHLPLP